MHYFVRWITSGRLQCCSCIGWWTSIFAICQQRNYRHLGEVCNHFAYAHTFSIFIYFICVALFFPAPLSLISIQFLHFRWNSCTLFRIRITICVCVLFVRVYPSLLSLFVYVTFSIRLCCCFLVVVFTFPSILFRCDVQRISVCCFFLLGTVLFQGSCVHMNQYSNHSGDPKRMM